MTNFVAIKIRKKFKDEFELAVKFYSILDVLNNFKLSPLEIRILAYTAIKGNIARGDQRNDFIDVYKSTYKSVRKTVTKLVKQGYLTKDNRRIVVSPQLLFNIKDGILLQLNMGHE